MATRVGNADLYIGMVRKRKSLPRDSKGFEPIEQYFKEFDEEMNQDSNDSESGDETDIEEEKKKEEEAWEMRRRERQRLKKKAEENKRITLEKETKQLVTEQLVTEQSVMTERKDQKRKSWRPGSRRSLRQRGLSSDTDDRESSQSASDTEVGDRREMTHQIMESGGEEKEGDKRERSDETRPTATDKPEDTMIPATETETVSVEVDASREGITESVVGRVVGRGKDSGVNCYSPELTTNTSSPIRDTIKLGPVRLTFSASPSDDERRHRTDKPSTLAPVVNNNILSDNEHTSDMTRASNRVRQTVTEQHNNDDMSFNPKTTSTQVKGKHGNKRKPSTTKKKVISNKQHIDNMEDDEEEEEDVDLELMTLLKPSANVSRLVGLSQLTSRSNDKKKKSITRSRDKTISDSGSDEGDAPANKTETRSTQRKKKSQGNKKSSIRANTTTVLPTATNVDKKQRNRSRKSVAFNPHTTNLGSPEAPPPPVSTVPSAESDTVDSSSGGIYDYVPSDEEDLSHSKSRLYSPRRKSILRKAVESQQKKSKKRKSHGSGVQNERTGNNGQEIEQEVVSAAGDNQASVRELSVQVEDISNNGQWFVPDDLNIHKMISEQSPLSLRRLTRYGRRSGTEGNSTNDDGTVESPQRQKRNNRRPHELDSTVVTDDNTDGSHITGVSSSGDKVQERSHRKTKKGQKKNKRSSKSAKLTPPWMKKKSSTNDRTQSIVELPQHIESPQSPQECGPEENTPVPKKLRISTVEEDEGMQSGGGMSLSSSEDEQQDLVRSLGGRRYRRYVVEHQDSKTPGVRRSKRSRVAPVQHWRNEEPEYERRKSGVTLKSVLVPLQETDQRPVRRKRVTSEPSGDIGEVPLLNITDKHGYQTTLNIVTHPSLCDRINGQEDVASRYDELVITRLCSSPSTSCGLIELTYLGEKEKSTSNTHDVFFFVVKGRAQFFVGRQTFDLSTECQIRIPAGIPYAVKNIHRGLLKLYYHSHQTNTT